MKLRRKFIIFVAVNCIIFNAQAIVLGEFVGLSKEMQYGYVVGVVNSMMADSDRSKDEIACINEWGVTSAWNLLDEFYNKNKDNAQSGGINAAMLILLNSESKCDVRKITKSKTNYLSLADFTNQSKDMQTGYIAGVFDSYIVNAKYSNERTACIEKWGFVGLWNYLLNYYNKDKSSPAVLNANPAEVLQSGAISECGDERRDMSKLKPVK